ncbi:MAG: transglutaminase family protein [Bacteroidia bacterium]|nr:transglutaminase family protein [Bacteroidia bacterium]
MKKSEIKALIALLDDPDPQIYSHVKEKLLSKGFDVIPTLEDAWGVSLDSVLQERIEEIVHEIQFEDVQVSLKKWRNEPDGDIMEGSIIIAKFQYPDIDTELIYKELDSLRNQVFFELDNTAKPIEKIKVLNHFFYDVWKFKGNKKNYHSASNSYINNVIESRRGNPLLLSILYSYIAQGASVPIYGVNLPQHFVLAYVDDLDVFSNLDPLSSPEVLFYINTFNKGLVFTRKEIDDFIKQLNLKPQSAYFYPCSTKEMIIRMVHNLMHTYKKVGEEEKVEELKILLDILFGKE